MINPVQILDRRIYRRHHADDLIQRQAHRRRIERSVMQALVKQANAVRTATLTASAVAAAFLVEPSFL